MRLVLDTNIFIVGFLDLSENRNSPEVRILSELKNKKHVLVFSDKLEEQILRVVARVKDRNFVGLVRHLIWSDFLIEYFTVDRKTNFPEIPRKDLDIFLTAYKGSTDFLISNDRKFLEAASRSQNKFQCLNPQEFIKRFEV